ncbi:MAG: hypothetical protein WCE36_28915, partial [Pseudolabrys sp.]
TYVFWADCSSCVLNLCTRELPFLDSLLIDFPTVERPSLGTSMTSLAHDKPPLPNVVHADIAGAEKRLRELKGRFKCVSNK